MRFSMLVLLLLVCCAFGDDAGDSKEQIKLLQGAWSVVSLEVEGQAQPKDKAPKELIIAVNRLTGLGPEMTITIDATKKPRWIDLIFKKGEKEYPGRAIYEVTAEELKICIPLAEKGKPFDNIRPTSFETKGKKVALITAKRAPKQE